MDKNFFLWCFISISTSRYIKHAPVLHRRTRQGMRQKLKLLFDVGIKQYLPSDLFFLKTKQKKVILSCFFTVPQKKKQHKHTANNRLKKHRRALSKLSSKVVGKSSRNILFKYSFILIVRANFISHFLNFDFCPLVASPCATVSISLVVCLKASYGGISKQI